MAPNKPSLIPHYTATPEPGRILQGEEPIIVIKDAAMIYESHKIFPIKAHNSQYARYQAFSATGTKPVSTIIATSQREIEALDWIKLFEKKDSNTDCLARGLRGKGIVKQYEAMRTLGYIFQHMTVPVVELKAGYIGGHLDDIKSPAKTRPICPLSDEERNDLRLGGIYACILAMKAKYPNSKIYVYLRGDRIVGRYYDLVGIDGSLAELIKGETGVTVVLGRATKDFLTHMDDYLKVAANSSAHPPTLQPQPHPTIHAPVHFEFTDLAEDTDTNQWVIAPDSVPAFTTPATIEPRDRTILRVMCDTNEHSRHHFAYVDLVKRFVGKILFAAIPEVFRELQEGTDPAPAAERKRLFKSLIRMDFTEMLKVKYGSRTWFYGADQSPKLVKPPKGDLRIRLQIAEAIEELERNFPGEEIVVLFITNDYNMELTMGGLMPARARLLCLRTEVGESGSRLMDIVSGVLKPWLK